MSIGPPIFSHPPLSEDGLIERYFAPLAGPGGFGLRDDAALVKVPPDRELVVTKDALVAGVHFFADDPPDAIARKALRVNLSDLAAKGAHPHGYLLALALPKSTGPDWLGEFARGLAEDAQTYALGLLGGDTVKTPGPLMLSVTAFGLVEMGRMVHRMGVQSGDILYVTGTIGDAALGLQLRLGATGQGLDADSVSFLLDRYLLPCPRNSIAAALGRHAHGAMDISDGFVGDLRKMLRVSGVGARIELSRVPLSAAARAAMALQPELFVTAMTGGDDYELVCAIPEAQTQAFEEAAIAAKVPVTRIGVAEAGDVVFVDAQGRTVAFESGSFSHF